jgi:sulfite reductase (ferredoxin)
VISNRLEYKIGSTNTFEQKQSGFYGVYIKVLLGNISSATARKLAKIINAYASSEDVRINY